MDEPLTLTKVNAYLLKSLFRTPFVSRTEYIKMGLTTDFERVGQFLSQPSLFDQCGSSSNVYENITVYSDKEGNLYEIKPIHLEKY